jgi:predicted MFS family arabinose efflux permease
VLLARPIVQLSYLMTATVMVAGFVLIPNMASYMQLNLSFPRELIKYAYMFGGVMSLVATQVGGRLVDRFGSFRVGSVGTLLGILTVYLFYFRPLSEPPSWAVYLSYMMFMLANGLRNVSYNTLTSKVVEPELRARFQSLQSAVQHGAGAVAAFTSAQMLARAMRPSDLPGTSAWVLVGMDKLAAISMGLSAMIPLLMLVVEMRLTRSAAMVALPEPAKR